MKNQDIRQAIKAAKVKCWEVAERYGLTDSYFSRKLRHELSSKEKAKIYAIIAEIEKEHQAEENE